MTIEQLTTFFMWCTVIGGSLLIVSSILCMLLKNVIGKMHGKLFGMAPETVKPIVYGYIGLFKILWFVFMVIPWLALLIMTCECGK